jgi:hypothetical protein
MSNWTKRDEARVNFLNACVDLFRTADDPATGGRVPVGPGMGGTGGAPALAYDAWRKYRDLIDGKVENLPLNEHRWFCPHCGQERPPLQFQLIGEALIGIGALQYFNVACANEACRRLLAVNLVSFIPDAVMVEEARRQMAAQKKMRQ